jgi:hypothetical protein
LDNATDALESQSTEMVRCLAIAAEIEEDVAAASLHRTVTPLE